MADQVVRCSHVSKRFCLGEMHDSLRDLIPATVARLLRWNGARRGEEFWALDDMDFAVDRGESVGIIGPNGAGKSTILKLLSGILRPDSGEIEVRGRLAALIEIGAGFHQDLTGRENVYLNGAILGMDRREIRNKLDAIIAFAGLERFMDMPVKRYSSGMYARLGFSIAAHVDPEILLVDEVLSVGDAVFRLRCLERMRQLLREGTTLIFVTHNLQEMQSICQRAMVLEEGRNVFTGPAREAVGHYLSVASRSYAPRPTDVRSQADGEQSATEVVNVRFLDENDDEVLWVRPRQTIRAELTLRLRRHVPRLVVELNMRASLHQNLLSVNSGRDGLTFDGTVGLHQVTLLLRGLPVCGGQYLWNVRVWDADRSTTEVDTAFKFPLVVDDEGRTTGAIYVDHDWTVKTGPTEGGATSNDDLPSARPIGAGVGA